MTFNYKSSIIYGDAPFIEDMGVLTTLCLLYDEVLLFGSKSLGEHLNEYWENSEANSDAQEPTVVEQAFQVLLPEGVISFLSPSDASDRFQGDEIDLPGIEGFETKEIDGKTCVVVKGDLKKLNHVSRLVLGGLSKSKEPRTVSSLLRDASIVSSAIKSKLPIVCEQAHIALAPSTTRVSEIANFLAHRIFQRLTLPELRAYHADDILEARLKLKTELDEFRAGILELVWLLHQHKDITGDLKGLGRDCDILIDTKIKAAVLLLEQAILNHSSKKVRRILKSTAGALLELGKSLISPNWATGLIGGGSALVKVSESLEKQTPSIQIASFVYKVREKAF